VAILYFQVTPISRGSGRSAVAAAAYRSGERLRDERTGKLHNYSRRIDIPHKEILLPSGFNAANAAWLQDRQQLWNAAERAERQRNARVAREFQLGLPHELSADQRRELARAFSQELADRYQVVVDLAIHEPRPAGDPRNHHAHLLLSSREVTETGFGAKAGLDMQSDQCRRRGLPVGIAEIKAARQRWASLTNEALRSAGLETRVDHRNLQAQGIDRIPMARLPYPAVLRERQGLRSEVAERVRANHLARVQARRARSAMQDATKAGESRDQAPTSDRGATKGAVAPDRQSTIDELQRQAREAWMQLRRDAGAARGSGVGNEPGNSQPAQQATLEDDLSL
jgi:ATP-dependent exoDNAse (exonuclease V) alpha subunit